MEQLSYGWILYIFDPLIWIHATVLLFIVGLSDPGIIPRKPDPSANGTKSNLKAKFTIPFNYISIFVTLNLHVLHNLTVQSDDTNNPLIIANPFDYEEKKPLPFKMVTVNAVKMQSKYCGKSS